MNFRKYFLPSLLVLLLGGSFAIGQNFNRALQLSQDTTGAFSVDTNNGVYFPGHILSTGTGRPSPTANSGATTPTITGTDFAGTVTANAAATTATVTFGQAYVSVPACVISINNSLTTTIAYTRATTSLALTWSGAAGADNIVNYFCTSVS